MECYVGVKTPAAIREGYKQLSQLGARVAVAEMVESGVEVAFGMLHDPQFGPIIMVGTGGTLVEITNFALPPFGKTAARRLLEQLQMAPLFRGYRGSPPADMDALAQTLSQFSVVCDQLRGLIEEIDLNPVIATSTGCMAVDAVIVLRGSTTPSRD